MAAGAQTDHYPSIQCIPSILHRSAINIILIVSAQHRLFGYLPFPSMRSNWKSQVTLKTMRWQQWKTFCKWCHAVLPVAHTEAALLYGATLIILNTSRGSFRRVCRRKIENGIEYHSPDRLCGVVVRVSDYRYRGLGFDSRRYQIFWVVVGLERGPLSLVRSNEELLE